MAEIIDQVMSEQETSFKVRLDFPDNFTEEDKNGVLADVADFVKNALLDSIGEGETPIQGGKWKKTLSPKYADKKLDESGSDIANLELFGDLLDAFDYEIDDDGVKFFIDGDQAVKSYAHNTGYEGHPTIPEGKYFRQFIPQDGQKLKSSIMKEIDSILEEAISANQS